MNQRLSKFIRLTQITLLFVYLVMLAGAVVRATGAGMGCPDWPKCFGQYIPPTDVSQLPENYKKLYAGEHGAVEEFNALKTWIEYINRLFGAILGILIFIQFVFSFFIHKRIIILLSFVELILIGFQAWLGAKVVSSNLAPYKITTHMVAALIILIIGLIITHKAKQIKNRSTSFNIPTSIKTISVIVLLLSITQIMMGTQVRETVDALLKNTDVDLRNTIIDNLGLGFKVHRSFSIIIALLNFWLIYKIFKTNLQPILKSSARILAFLLLVEITAGIILSYFALPAFLQPVHMLFATFIFAVQFKIILNLFNKK